MRENDLNRDYRLYVEDPYVWISPFEAYARTQYELQKTKRDIKRAMDAKQSIPSHRPAEKGLWMEKILDLEIHEASITSIKNKF